MTPTDELAFIGDPGFFRPEVDEVYVSCTFTWDKQEAIRLAQAWSQYYRVVELGGPAFDDRGAEFIPGRFVKQGVTITSRGCPRGCPWCVVPKREGRLRLLKIKPGNIVQDNNLLACHGKHIEAVFKMLESQKRIVFSGGLDAQLLNRWHAEWISEHRKSIRELWFAADSDSPRTWDMLELAAYRLGTLSRKKLRCYVLIGWNGEAIHEAEWRLSKVWKLGFLPFAQFYRGPGEQKRTSDWAKLQRAWSRPAAMYTRLKP